MIDLPTLQALTAALLPAILLWLYIWKKDAQPEPAGQLLKTILWGVAIAVCILLVPVLAQGIYDTIALSGQVNPYIRSLSSFILIWFCVKMHKTAKTKMLALVKKDNYHFGEM